MRASWRLVARLAAVALLLALPRAGFGDDPVVTVTPGYGVVWPDDSLGVENTAEQYGGILGMRVLPMLAVEGRGHYCPTRDRAVGGQDRHITHGEGNLTFFPLTETPLQPYLTAGVGAVNAHDVDDKFKLALNGGVGFRTAFVAHCAWRLDVRDVSYKFKSATDEKWMHSIELFTGLSIGFGGKPKDTDLDGVPDKLDRCPNTPPGALVDAKGCPLDGDGDGIYDGLDRCSGTPHGATVDASGCPKDSDGDGIYDGLDRCAGTPKGCLVDASGCPKDADGDGVCDGLDKCPDTPKGCLVDASGCPKDSDRDGVCDGLDKCPDTPPMTKVDAMGCPIPVSEKETQLRERGEIRLQNVNFVTGKADLMPASFAVLDEVGQVLSRYGELKIEIGGHTDSRGATAANQKLSQARAQTVLDYLLDKFPQLDQANLTAVGYGETKPIADNGTEAGRAQNRRVEFRVLNPEALKQ